MGSWTAGSGPRSFGPDRARARSWRSSPVTSITAGAAPPRRSAADPRIPRDPRGSDSVLRRRVGALVLAVQAADSLRLRLLSTGADGPTIIARCVGGFWPP